ncbi:MAG TPA: tyrosine-type recombinase/integrase, partial [Gemmatimonadaceae bacterium]|nr:tyrosine-type recombinase/integrase [Gemmatimonadaceae bacterium]
ATGMRMGEYMRTTKEHLRSETLSIDVPGTKTRGSKAVVYVAESLWPWIEAGVPSPLQYKWARQYWVRACVEVGLGRYTEPKRSRGYIGPRFHDLRHCHGQWAVSAGVPEAAVQAALRHSTAEMTRRYTTTKNKGDVARAIGNVLTRPTAE